MQFDGSLLKRGFWLYIWDIRGNGSRNLYVGRTGDSSSANASSPFRRIGQHLDSRINAKGNALGRRLRNAKINPEACIFEMTAIGPLFEEQMSMEDHRPVRDKMAALERALADELKNRGYTVLGSHPRATVADTPLMQQIITAVDELFPVQPARFQPVQATNGASASEIILRDRQRL